MAGQSDVTTASKDSLNEPLENSFDASSVNEELGAQVEITRAFGVEAPKAVGDFASNKQLQLILEGNLDEAEKWADDGVYRVALHTLVGALATGSIDGAVASGTSAVSVPALDNYFKEQGLDDTAREAVLLGFSASVGASIGGDTASTVNSFNQTDNNYLLHSEMRAWSEDIENCGKNKQCISNKNRYWISQSDTRQAKLNSVCITNYNASQCEQLRKEYFSIKQTQIDPRMSIVISRPGGFKAASYVQTQNESAERIWSEISRNNPNNSTLDNIGWTVHGVYKDNVSTDGAVGGTGIKNRVGAVVNIQKQSQHETVSGRNIGVGRGLSGKNWSFNPTKDVDLRGTSANYRDALDLAFQKTGVPKSSFRVTKWGKDKNGKSIPTEYVGPNGANVNLDIPKLNNVKSNGQLGEGPHEPHIDYQTPGKGVDRVRGHIFVDYIPTTRR